MLGRIRLSSIKVTFLAPGIAIYISLLLVRQGNPLLD